MFYVLVMLHIGCPCVFFFSGIQTEDQCLLGTLLLLKSRTKGAMAERCNGLQCICSELAHDIAIQISLAKARHVVKPDIREASSSLLDGPSSVQ